MDYITKPYSAPVVRAHVRTHVALKQRTDLLETLAFLDGTMHRHRQPSAIEPQLEEMNGDDDAPKRVVFSLDDRYRPLQAIF